MISAREIITIPYVFFGLIFGFICIAVLRIKFNYSKAANKVTSFIGHFETLCLDYVFSALFYGFCLYKFYH